MSIRAVPLAALMIAGLAGSAWAQFLAPGMPMPGQAPPQQQQQQQQQAPPCFRDFQPLKAEAEKRGMALKAAMQKKVSREEACTLIKHYSAAEAKVVKFIVENSQSCGIPAQAATSMKTNHERTLHTQTQICSTAGPARPTGPGLSEALGTTRIPGTTLDPMAPQSGTFDTLTGNVLSK